MRKWAKNIVGNHDEIAIEDFESKFPTKSNMAAIAADDAIGQPKSELV
ncbi:MAG: hypothetical protein ACYDHP_09105 [Ferrimicrobium sp.]